jgi:hypothetical protein
MSLLVPVAAQAAAIPVELGNEAVFSNAASSSSYLTSLILSGMGCVGLTALRLFKR